MLAVVRFSVCSMVTLSLLGPAAEAQRREQRPTERLRGKGEVKAVGSAGL